MIYDAAKAIKTSELLLEKGNYFIAFSYPVMPHGQARLRVQISAVHTKDETQRTVCAFIEARNLVEGREYELV